jgi:integrase
MTVKIRPYRRGGLEVDIMIRMPNGETYRERRKAPTDSRSAAMRWAKDRERHLLVHGPTTKTKGRVVAPDSEQKKEVPTIAEFAPRFMDGYAVANRHKPSTKRTTEYALRVHLLPTLGERRLDELNQEDIQRVKIRLAKHSPKTTNNILTTLSTLLKCAVELEEISELPIQFKRMRVPRKSMDFFDFDEYERLLDAAKALDPRYYAFVLAAGDAGLRAGEIRGLWWSAIDFKNRLLTVERADWRGQITTPKHDKLRTIPMTKRLSEALAALRHDQSKYVFLTDEGEPIHYQLHRMWLAWSLKRAGLRVKGSHTLRHTFCSHLAMRGVPAPAIQRLAGHSALATTERYMHLSPTMLESAIRMLEAPAPQALATRTTTTTTNPKRSPIRGRKAVGDRLETTARAS